MSTFTVNCLDSKAHFETVSFDNIEYNSVNDYSMTSIEELADNIKKNGLLHNIVLSKQKNGKYKILAGERRTRSIRLLHEQEPESWMTTEALVYEGLTERQEEIIMDSSNLQSRGNGGDEVQLRKATNRYIENMKAEYGLSDKQALKAATDIIKMEQNYRSDGNILNLANSLIGHNTKRHNKNLWTYRNPGVMPTYTYYASDYDETDSIVEDIKDYIAAGNNYSDVAILYRNSRLS